MKWIHQAEDRRLIARMAGISAAALAAVVILNLLVGWALRQALLDSYAQMVGTVAQKYPLAEAQVVSDLHNPDPSAARVGYEVLGKYGLDGPGTFANGPAGVWLAWSVPAGLVLVGSVCGLFAWLLLRYRRTIAGQLAGLSGYIRQLEAGDYSLDIRDNDEGSLSLLKNDLFKITVRLREQAEQLARDKASLSDWIADISHQIKTPLTALGVLVDLLAEDPPETDRNLFITRLRLQLGRIQWLVTGLLKLARLDAGAVVFKSDPVNIQKMVEHALEPLQIPIEIKRLRLNVHGPGDAEYLGDFNWSAEALTNILKNSVEHTPEGGRIQVDFESNSLYAEIRVSDDGEGIASRDLPNLFTRFFRSQNAAENSVGIGLALAKAILAAQGGDITVQSEAGVGTCFVVRIFQSVV